jgi:two-component system, OmpR family, sensor kinase
MSRLSLRLRLTLSYSAIVAVVVLVGVGLTLFFMRGWLLRPIDREIVFQVNAFGKAAQTARSETELAAVSRDYLASASAEELRTLGYTLFLWTSSGDIVSNAATPLERFPASQQVFGGGPGFSAPRTIASPTGEAFRAAIVPLTNGGQRAGLVIVAAPLVQLNEHLRQFAYLFGALGLAALIGSAVGTWFLIGLAFRPVEAITETALVFSREDPSGRIAYQGPPDEIGHLVSALNDMLDRVERSFREQQQFLYDASHELRTPLSIVKGHLEVLDGMGDMTTDMCRDAHQVVLEEIDRMNRLVSGLLTLAKSGDQGFLVLEDLRLDEFLEPLFTHAVHLGDRRWILDPSPPLVVRGDADRLTQVMLNLLRNAVEHTQPGDVIALGVTQEGRWARVHVRDEGEGIPPEQLGSVFNRFFSRKKGGKGGYGLGLSIADALVKAHGGRIVVTSEVGEGSTFSVLLPVSDGGQE